MRCRSRSEWYRCKGYVEWFRCKSKGVGVSVCVRIMCEGV